MPRREAWRETENAQWCRTYVGDARFEQVCRQLVSVEQRDAAFEVLIQGCEARLDRRDLKYEREIEQALRDIGTAITRYKRAQRPAGFPEFLPWDGEALEREYEALRRAHPEPDPPAPQGRPEAFWRRDAEVRLRALGIRAHECRAILRAAGLISTRS